MKLPKTSFAPRRRDGEVSTTRGSRNLVTELTFGADPHRLRRHSSDRRLRGRATATGWCSAGGGQDALDVTNVAWQGDRSFARARTADQSLSRRAASSWASSHTVETRPAGSPSREEGGPGPLPASGDHRRALERSHEKMRCGEERRAPFLGPEGNEDREIRAEAELRREGPADRPPREGWMVTEGAASGRSQD